MSAQPAQAGLFSEFPEPLPKSRRGQKIVLPDGTKATFRPIPGTNEITFRVGSFVGKATRQGTGKVGKPRNYSYGEQARDLAEVIARALAIHLEESARLREAKEPPARQTIKRPKKKKLSSKLCLAPVEIDWEAKRFIPFECEYEFSKVPSPLRAYESEFSRGEWGVLTAALEIGAYTGECWGSKRWCELARIYDHDFRIARESVANRGFLRRTGEERDGAPVFELLWHPWYGPMQKRSINKGGERRGNGGGTAAQNGPAVHPNQIPLNQTATADDSTERKPSTQSARENRALSSGKESGERFARSLELLTSTEVGREWAKFIGDGRVRDDEARKNGAMWLRIFTEEADTLYDLIENGERLRATELRTALSRVKFLTKRLAERRTK